MRWYLILAVALASLLLACGDGGQDEREIKEAVEGFFLALNEDPPKAYTYLSQDCKEQISFLQFATGLSLLEGFLGKGEPEVKDFEIKDREGDELQADVEVVVHSEGEEIALTQDPRQRGPTRFVKEDGRWRFSDCDVFGGQDAFGVEEVATPEEVGPTTAQRAEADDDPDLPGQHVDLPALYGGPYPDTAQHESEQIDYRAQGLPPAGGPHWGQGACPIDPADAPLYCGPVPAGFYIEPWEAESLVHNMEHAGVVVWYNTDDQGVIDDLRELAQENSDLSLVVAPFPEMEEETIAITAWSRRDKFPTSEYDRARLQEFFDAHACRFDPEELCGGRPQERDRPAPS